MPQLDRIIVFSQIFWLFIIFTTFYTIVTHFFLPNFLKSLKSRKQIIESNSLEIAEIAKESDTKRNVIQKILVKNLVSTKNILTNNLSVILMAKKNLNMFKIDEKISIAIFNTIKYCDSQLLNFISLRPKLLNLKFN
nr:ATP synthase F0 subunit 8 [Polyopes affinis]